MAELERYARIETVMPREFLLLQGRGCVWKKCTFCDYHTDTSGDPFSVNRPVLERVTGRLRRPGYHQLRLRHGAG